MIKHSLLSVLWGALTGSILYFSPYIASFFQPSKLPPDAWRWALFILVYIFGITFLVWLVYFLPLFVFTNSQNKIWSTPVSVLLGALSGSVAMFLFIHKIKGAAWFYIVAAVIGAVSFLVGGIFKRRHLLKTVGG